MTFYGLAQTIFKSYIKILLLVKKIIVFWCLGLHLDKKDSVITLDPTNYSENLKLIASNYDNESNLKDLLQSQIWNGWVAKQGQILILKFANICG